MINDENMLNHYNKISSCKACCFMCSCKNRKGFWKTKCGKSIIYIPIVILIIPIIIVAIDLLGLGVIKLLFNKYNIETGCIIGTKKCENQIMCYIDDYHALIIGCAAVGSMAIVVLVIGLLILSIMVGCFFYCFDSCCSEISKSYEYSKVRLQRNVFEN